MHGVETVLNVLGSVALLLWGVRMVRTGLTRAFGATLRRAIAACARNRFKKSGRRHAVLRKCPETEGSVPKHKLRTRTQDSVATAPNALKA